MNRTTDQAVVRRTDLERALAAVGIRPGELLFAHSSLSAFGHVDGGADTVLDALLAAVGPRGTVALPTFTWREFALADSFVWDQANTPCETGLIPETFRRRPGVLRSDHVCHSIAAQGPLANALMGRSGRSFGVGSSLHQLYELDSWYLFLGVDFRVCTALHMVEELVGVPYRVHRTFPSATVREIDGLERPARSVEYLRQGEVVNDFPAMEEVYREAGLVREAAVGATKILNLRLREIIDLGCELVAQDPWLLTTEPR